MPKNDFAFNKTSITSNNESYSNYYDIDNSYSFFVDDLNISFEDNNSHTIESYMVKLQNQYFKIIYTSDIGTTNLNKLVDFCKNADLIICESSFLKKHNANSRTHRIKVQFKIKKRVKADNKRRKAKKREKKPL